MELGFDVPPDVEQSEFLLVFSKHPAKAAGEEGRAQAAWACG